VVEGDISELSREHNDALVGGDLTANYREWYRQQDYGKNNEKSHWVSPSKSILYAILRDAALLCIDITQNHWRGTLVSVNFCL
jgi:hypothetical protein